MKLCQGPKCHEHKTKDRIRGPKGDKHYETRKRSSFYYGNGNFCDQRCMYDWIEKFGERALDHFGRITQPIKCTGENAWVKDYVWRSMDNHQHYFINDLLGERRPITQAQYDDENLTTPTTS